MINIDHLNIQLPRGFESRANDIAHQTAQLLARYPHRSSCTIEKLNVPAILVHGGEANGVIAKKIAQAIHQQLNTMSGE